MTSPGPDAATAGGLTSAIGRYFSVVSFVPSLLLVAWVVFLAKSGAWTRTLDWSSAVKAFLEPSVMGVALVVLVSLALGIAMHPLQFIFVQSLEGYWGTGQVAIASRAIRTIKYSEFRHHLLDLARHMKRSLARVGASLAGDTVAYAVLTAKNEAYRQESYYPTDDDDMMPTRLGNVLKSYEMQAGSQYGLPILDFAEHLAHVAPREQVEYINDQRTALDLAVRFCFVSLFGTIIAVIFLWQHGIWLLTALLPYLLAYCCYRGAIVVAYHYGKALSALVDLNRFALYERLRVEMPLDTVKEREQGVKLTRLVRYSDVESVKYVPDKSVYDIGGASSAPENSDAEKPVH